MTSFVDPDLDLQIRLPDVAQALVGEALDDARRNRWVERFHDLDTSLWSADPQVQATIAQWLGWLRAPEEFRERIPALEGFGDGIRAAGFTGAVVMGMGGSSLAAEVLSTILGSPDFPAVGILDSTHPAAVAAIVDGHDPLSTLWIVASKSGRTVESLAFQADTWTRTEAALRQRRSDESPGQLMIAVTDPGRSVESIPHHDDFREVFLNPTDIGGRYSALSYPGLVPAAIAGVDLDALMASAGHALSLSREPDPARNAAAALGITMGALARQGRDKLTLIVDPEIAGFGAWAEQLIAESTGKHGKGIVPVDLEPLGSVAAYDSDRVFVRIRLEGSAGPAPAPDGTTADQLVAALAAAGHPVISVRLSDPIDLGGEFVRWEVATAMAGAVLGIDPFDQPNVEEAKELTRQFLAGHDQAAKGHGSAQAVPTAPDAPSELARDHGIAVYGDDTLADGHADQEATVRDVLARHLERRRPGAYLALQAFLAPSPATDAALARIRALLRDRTRCATTAGYGPRYLHSTGQLHKGGTPSGWFLQLTADHGTEREIPGWPYSFGQLIDAQARGDLAALASHDLPVARVHLGHDVAAGLATLERLLAEILGDR